MEAAARLGYQKLVFRHGYVEPGRPLIAAQHYHLPIVVGFDVFVRCCREDRVGLGSMPCCWTPDAREIEKVAALQFKAVTLSVTAMTEFRRRHLASMICEGAAFRVQDRKRSAAAFAGLEAPVQLDDLNIVADTPYEAADRIPSRNTSFQRSRKH